MVPKTKTGDPPNADQAGSNGPKLRRRINLPLLTLYGVGTTVGAGIYVLIGKVAGRAGLYAPLSFLVAAILAGLTAFAFAELAARYPRSAGEALYVRAGFGSPVLSLVVGLMVIAAGVVSAATVINGSVGYLAALVDLPRPVAICAITALLFLIAAWGIGESVLAAGLVTLVEVGALLVVCWVALSAAPLSAPPVFPPLESGIWFGILTGGFLAFYAFIGFEDMVNVAEEVKNVTRTLPVAILITLGLTTVIYFMVALVAVMGLPLADLAGSDAPLALLYSRSTGSEATAITVIAVFATLNGALIQIIMGSRVLYGLAAQGALPALLGRVHPWTRTPLIATLAVAGVVLALALPFQTERLAGLTSLIALVIFILVNLALLRIKRREPTPPGITCYPVWLPASGAAISAGFLFLELWRIAACLGFTPSDGPGKDRRVQD